jgi:AraC family transcriptional regulator
MSTPSLPLNSTGAAPFSAGPMAQALLDMLGRAERALEVDPRQAKVFLGQASRLLEPTLGASKIREPGLAPWQERKVLRHIGDHIDQPTSNQDLADLVGMSVSHFARRFKGSFGVSPRDYMIRGRVERAKTLMRDTNTSLCQIALDSGFCDQAHMSRLFHAVVGSTPSRWRREQMYALAA